MENLRHTLLQTQTLSPHTHPSWSPASLPPLVSVSLGREKKKKKVKITPVSDFPLLSLPQLSTSSPQHSSFLRLPLLRTRTSYPKHEDLQMEAPLFSCPVLSSSSSSLFSLHSTVPLLSFPSLLSALAPPPPPPPPPSHSSLNSLTFVCQPPASSFPLLTHTHTHIHNSPLPLSLSLSSPFSF